MSNYVKFGQYLPFFDINIVYIMNTIIFEIMSKYVKFGQYLPFLDIIIISIEL
jgi:hypothetical protein